ncbi:MAG: hypothetical protein Q9226_004794 [Calogaya cf. arnoldii]
MNFDPTRLGIPPYFTVDTSVIDDGVALASKDVFMTAVIALEGLCFDLRVDSRQQIRQAFSIRGNNVCTSVVRDEVPPYRFAAWAVQRTVEASHRSNYASIKSHMRWHGQPVGQMDLGPVPAENTEAAAEELTLKVEDSSPPSANVAAGLGARHELQLIPGFTGIDTPIDVVMLTILKVMVSAVQEGPEDFCDNIIMPHFVLRSQLVEGQRVLKWGQVSKMMRVLARWMVRQDRYGEVSFLIKRDGYLIAIGTIKRE